MSSPALQAHLDPAGKVLDDPPAFLLWDRSYCWLQVRDSLGVVAIHPVLKVSPQIKIWGFKSGECGDHCGSHLRLISRSGKRCCSHANDGTALHIYNYAVFFWKNGVLVYIKLHSLLSQVHNKRMKNVDKRQPLAWLCTALDIKLLCWVLKISYIIK